jgi:hypothetical protein
MFRSTLSPSALLSLVLLAGALPGCVEEEGGKGLDSSGEGAVVDGETGVAGETGTAGETGESSVSSIPEYCEELGVWGFTEEGFRCPDDADCDGLDDAIEAMLGSDPANWDSDFDCIADSIELEEIETHPLCADTDGDGLTDLEEIHPDTERGDPLDPTRPEEVETVAPDCLASLNPLLADLSEDPDEDGLSSREDLLCGADPLDENSDEDALLDGDECEQGCDPMVEDSDGDGLMDHDEVSMGLSCTKEDSDADSLLDGAEVENGCDPTEEDTDGDGLLDAEEAELGTDCASIDTDGDGLDDASEDALDDSDPLDPLSRADVVAVNETVSCTDATAVKAFNWADVAYYGGEASRIGGAWKGPECQCTFDVHSTPKRRVTGVSVAADQSIHDGTDWETNPNPRGVLLSASSWSWLTTETGSDLDFVRSEPGDTLTEQAGYWFAFEEAGLIISDPTKSVIPVVVTDTVAVRVSYGNSTGDPIGDGDEDCSVLNAFVDDTGTTRSHGLTFYVSADEPEVSGAAPTVPPGTARACSGPTSGARFALLPGAAGPVPAPLGPAQTGGAQLYRVEVDAWNGAERLRVEAGGQRYLLTPERPTLLLDEPVALSEVGWEAARLSEGTWRNPELLLSTACEPPEEGTGGTVPVYQAGWSQAHALLSAAGAQSALAELWPDADLDDTSAFRLRVLPVEEGAPPPVPAYLRLDAAGVADLHYLPLSRWPTDRARAAEVGALESWGVSWGLDGARISGALLRTSGGLDLVVEELAFAGVSVPLEAPLTLSFPAE